jgi:hypothetical protein
VLNWLGVSEIQNGFHPLYWNINTFGMYVFQTLCKLLQFQKVSKGVFLKESHFELFLKIFNNQEDKSLMCTITHYRSCDLTKLCDRATTRTCTISHTIILDHRQPIVRYLQQSRYTTANEDRANWSYFDLLFPVVWFQNRAIRCDWGLTKQYQYACVYR